MYKIEELTQSARKIFNASPAAVRAALEISGKKTFSLDEAKQIVEAFLIREVKTDGSNLAARR